VFQHDADKVNHFCAEAMLIPGIGTFR